MSDLTHFDAQPLHIDPQSKAIGLAQGTKPSRALATELDRLNTLHRALISGEGVTQHGAPLPPVPVKVSLAPNAFS